MHGGPSKTAWRVALRRAARVAMAGEPFRTAFDPAALRARLEGIGFSAIADLGAAELNARYFAGRTDCFAVVGATGRVVSAEVASTIS